jgi:hypothetical protein
MNAQRRSAAQMAGSARATATARMRMHTASAITPRQNSAKPIASLPDECTECRDESPRQWRPKEPTEQQAGAEMQQQKLHDCCP